LLLAAAAALAAGCWLLAAGPQLKKKSWILE
jgi:hypothetical protein